MRKLIAPDRVWNGTADFPSEGAAVIVSGNRIEEIVERGTCDDLTKNLETVPLPGCTLLPGLIDCHVHLATAPGASDNDVTITIGARLHQVLRAMRALLDNGFTTVRDLGCPLPEPLVMMVRESVTAGALTGPRLLVAPHILSARAGHGDVSPSLGTRRDVELGALADGVPDIVRQVRVEARSGADWIKFAGTGGFFSPTDHPKQTSYTQDEMNALVAAARDLGLPCAVHAFGDEGIRRAVLAGVRSVEHGALARAETLAEMAQRGTFLVPTRTVLAEAVTHLDDDDYWVDRTPGCRAKFRELADELEEGVEARRNSSVKIAYGTDAGTLAHEENGSDFAALSADGLSVSRILRAATSTAAELLELPEAGRIAAGVPADLVAVQGNPFATIDAMTHVQFVMKDGEVHKHVKQSSGS
ncbi:metal-dependent hydrolase family protein [Streptomyces huasconensis]|uniref:metal-dependent hydrolase family protein n=1 Tax=Streptomyces huasconensis TaxID=1854574 RepID=UPI0036FAB264